MMGRLKDMLTRREQVKPPSTRPEGDPELEAEHDEIRREHRDSLKQKNAVIREFRSIERHIQ